MVFYIIEPIIISKKKRDFALILENFLTAGYLVLLRPFVAAGHIATLFYESKNNHHIFKSENF